MSGYYQWRLQASNGRTVAVSAAEYRTSEEADRALSELRRDAVEQLARITHVKEGAGWV
uniref:DUF1508 domain-containing protein n=1 Tax=Peterkaempfera griseoplana TaxID=66896 RepID=UPI000A91BB9B